MAKWQYTKGLHDIGDGLYAYLVPDGSWGWSNAGLVADGGEALLVDTLFDLPLTSEMLATMRSRVPAAKRIGALVNTHGNGDHTFGNQLLEGSRIIAAQGCVDDMKHRPPEQYAGWMREWPNMGLAGKFWHEVIGSRFDFSGIRLTLPNETFAGELTVKVGDKEVRLVEVGPAHTRGDVLVYVPCASCATTSPTCSPRRGSATTPGSPSRRPPRRSPSAAGRSGPRTSGST